MAGDEARRQNAVALLLFMLVSLAFMLRFAISPVLLDQFIDYTTEGGRFYEKFHVGTYAIFMLLPVALALRPVLLRPEELPSVRTLIRFAVLATVLAAITLGLGRSDAAGYLLDTYLVAAVAGLLMYCVNAPTRRAIGHVVLGLMLANATIGIVEAITRIRINPYDLVEDGFRPTGLTNHPLSLGLVCATAIGFAAIADWKLPTRIAAVLLLLVGAAASGARFSTLLAAGSALSILMLVRWPGLSPQAARKAKLVALVMAAVAGTVLVAALLSGGLLSRLSRGIVDENFFARLTVYEVFGYTGWSAILFGTDIAAVLKIVNERIGLPYIESSPVVFVYNFGLPLALVFAWAIMALFRRLLRGASLPIAVGTAAFFLAALSNNTLSTKTPLVAMVVVLIIAFNPPAGDGVARTRRSSPAFPPG